MAKFRLAPFGTVFSALKVMLDDFVGTNVDAVAELLDTAGRFLYRLPETHVRMANMAEVHGTTFLTHQPLSCGCLSSGDIRRKTFRYGISQFRAHAIEQSTAVDALRWPTAPPRLDACHSIV